MTTPEMRFAANRWLCENGHHRGIDPCWHAVQKALCAESFPDGYTPEVVDAALLLLALFGSELRVAEFTLACARMSRAVAAGRYGEGLR